MRILQESEFVGKKLSDRARFIINNQQSTITAQLAQILSVNYVKCGNSIIVWL